MKVRTLMKQELEHSPWLVWNAFVDLLATEKYEDLSPEQRPAHLVFWYESEVQNGGHMQLFRESQRAAHKGDNRCIRTSWSSLSARTLAGGAGTVSFSDEADYLDSG